MWCWNIMNSSALFMDLFILRKFGEMLGACLGSQVLKLLVLGISTLSMVLLAYLGSCVLKTCDYATFLGFLWTKNICIFLNKGLMILMPKGSLVQLRKPCENIYRVMFIIFKLKFTKSWEVNKILELYSNIIFNHIFYILCIS
jgi:hypothetical protein